MTDDNENGELSTNMAEDGGWGWIVVGCSFFVMFMIDGLFGSYGLLLPVLMEGLQASPSLTSLAGSLIVGSLLFVAIVACPLTERFGCRAVSICGAFIGALGLVLGSLSLNIWMFLATYGFITGCGIGLMYLPSIVMVNRYFDQKRGIATSIMSAGSGIGMMVISPLVENLLDLYDWRGTLLILAGLFLQLCVACALYRPPKVILAKKQNNVNFSFTEIEDKEIDCDQDFTTSNDHVDFNKYCDNIFKENECKPVSGIVYQFSNSPLGKLDQFKNSTCSLPKNMFRNHSEHKHSLYFRSGYCLNGTRTFGLSSQTRLANKSIFSQKDIFYCGSINHLNQYSSMTKNSLGSKVLSGDEIRYSGIPLESSGSSSSDGNELNRKECIGNLFANKPFLFVAFGAFLTQMAQFIPNMFLGDIGLTIGLDSGDVAWIFSVFGIINTLGRLLPGFVIDHTRVSATCLCTVGMGGCALTCFLFPLCNNFATLMTFSTSFGFFIALFCPLQPIMVLDSVGLDNLTRGLGILTVLKGPAAIAGPPLAGALYEWTKDYNVTIIFAGCLCLATALVYMIYPVYNSIFNKNDQKDDDSQKTL